MTHIFLIGRFSSLSSGLRQIASGAFRHAAAVGIVALMGASAAAQTAPVRVGSKIDTEGKLIGNMMVLALEANGIKTQSKEIGRASCRERVLMPV